jgi:hypothetical protein
VQGAAPVAAGARGEEHADGGTVGAWRGKELAQCS